MKKGKLYWSHCTYMGSLSILYTGIQPWRSTIVALQCHIGGARMGSTLSFFLGSRICAFYNRWVVEGETWRIQGTICIRDAYESLQVSTGMRGRKFGACFSWSHYCVQCWGESLTLDATHRSRWSCIEIGDWIGSNTLHIGVHNSEENPDSTPYLF